MEVLADEVNADMYTLSGAELKGGPLRGQGVALLTNMLEKARKTKKNSIVVIDEFEQIYHEKTVNGYSDRETLSVLQTEMEGVNSECNNKIVFIGLTNQPTKLNKAISRRFNLIRLSRPDKQARKDFLEFCLAERKELKKVKENCTFSEDINFSGLAQKTEGFVQDKLKTLVDNIFIRVAEQIDKHEDGDLLVVDGKIEIRQEEFEVELKKLKEQTKIGEEDFLEKSDYPMSEAARRMYS